MLGKLFVISAPSGAGKTSLIHLVLARIQGECLIERVITYTTKEPRKGEVHGEDYYFISPDEFRQQIEKGFFLEWSTAYGAYYGSPRHVLDWIKDGRSFIMIIDRVGAYEIAKITDNVVLIWIYTQNLNVLQHRLQKRATETESQMKHRIEQAKIEIQQEQQEPLFHFHILNDDFNTAIYELEQVFRNKLLKVLSK